MSRSTPISNLPNIKNKQANSSTAYEAQENQLVQEILKEIDTEKNGQQEQEQEQVDVQAQQVQAQAQAQQQQQQAQAQAHMQEQQMMHEQMLENASQEKVLESEGMVANLINTARQPLIVAAIAIIISIPTITNFLEGFIKSKESLLGYSTIIILLVKGIIAGGLYFGINKSM